MYDGCLGHRDFPVTYRIRDFCGIFFLSLYDHNTPTFTYTAIKKNLSFDWQQESKARFAWEIPGHEVTL